MELQRVYVRMIVGVALMVAGMLPAAAATVAMVEYYKATIDQYFSTADGAEIAAMDSAAGWVRSGQSFEVWPTAQDAPADAAAACLYTAPELGPQVRVYSIDTAECSALAGSGFTRFAATPFYAMRSVDGLCGSGLQPVYRGFRSTVPHYNFRYATALAVYQDSMDRGWSANGVVMCVPGVSSAVRADIHRLLRQATFGATDALVARIGQIGTAAWLEEQFNAPKSRCPVLPYVPFNRPDTCTGTCARDNYSLFPVQTRFLQNALTGEDQLRQRVAFALSQIVVTSGVEISHAYGMARYQQMLLDHAFGNYRDVLRDVTLSPVMGRFLDMANSNKPDAARGISANENFAREMLQLFSVGLYELQADGTPRRNAEGALIPTYTQATVENFARVFTGWTYPTVDGSPAVRNNGVNYAAPMVPVQSNHDVGTKALFGGTVLPAGRSAQQDLDAALANIFNHPNVGPFISRQLIQKLVAGSPSAAYVARVAAVFDNNGSGVRGDLKAVVRAILLDREARGAIQTASDYGHLLEPVLLTTGLVRGLNGRSDGVFIAAQLPGMAQNLFYAPSVFNYYPPDRVLPASGSTAPEFAILTASTVFSRANFVNSVVMGNAIAPDRTVQGAIGTALDLGAFQTLAADPAGLVDKLAWTFTAGSLSSSARDIIVRAVAAVPAGNSLLRARTAAYLVINASQTQVER